MDKKKKEKLERAGWRFGTVEEFLRLSKNDSLKVEDRLRKKDIETQVCAS